MELHAAAIFTTERGMHMEKIVLGKIYDTFFKGGVPNLWGKIKENYILVICVVAVLAALIAVCTIYLKKQKQTGTQEDVPNKKKPLFDIRSLSFAAMCLAIGFVLSYIKIVDLPQGGAITPVSMLPVILFAYIYGPKRGFIVSFVYCLMQIIQDFYVLNPLQFFFDYIFAFTILGIAGFFRKNLILGTITAHLLRYASHVIAAFAFFRQYNQTGINDAAYCLIYNSFVLIEMVACVIIEIVPPVRNGIEKMRKNLLKTVR